MDPNSSKTSGTSRADPPPDTARTTHPSNTMNTAYDAGRRQPGISNVLSYDESGRNVQGVDPATLVTQDMSNCSLGRSLSKATDASISSAHTMRSTKSTQSVQALGSYPLGSLRIHSGDVQEEPKPSAPCLQGGDVVIVTGVPEDSLFGYDTVSFDIGKDGHFEGIREIPPGPHFIYGGSKSGISTRNGFWIMSKQRPSGEPGNVFVKRWDKYTETIEEEVSSAEIRIQKDNVPSIFNKLMPYDVRAARAQGISQPKIGSATNPDFVDSHTTWQNLTSAIKGAMLSRITGCKWNEWKISSMDDCKSTSSIANDRTTHTRMDLASNRTNAITGTDHGLTFVFSPGSRTFSNTAVGRARSEQAMDTTSHIRTLVAERCTFEDQEEVIGELQFCYLTGMLLGNISCMEQWAHVVKLLFKAFQLAAEEPLFFRKIIEAFHAQLIYDDEYLEGSIFDHNDNLQNELTAVLTIFKSRLMEQLLGKGDALSKPEIELGETFEKLEAWLWKWGWDLRGNYVRTGKIQLEDGEYVDAEMEDFEAEDERGEYAPVIVELEEDGREKGMVRW